MWAANCCCLLSSGQFPFSSKDWHLESSPDLRSSMTSFPVAKASFIVVAITPTGPCRTQPLQYRPAENQIKKISPQPRSQAFWLWIIQDGSNRQQKIIPPRTQWLVPNFSFVVEYKGHVTWNDWIFHVGITGIWQLKQKPAITEESLATRKSTTVVQYRTVKRSIAREKWEKRKEKKKGKEKEKSKEKKRKE